MENHIFLMGKSSISRAIFNSYVRNYQRVTNLTSWFKWRLAQKKTTEVPPKKYIEAAWGWKPQEP